MAAGNKNLRSIIISGYYGFDNCGDEAILLAMIQEFSHHIPKDKIIVLSQNPHKTKRLYQVNAIHRLNVFSIITAMLRTSIFISGGGGLFQDVTGKGYSVFYYTGLIFLARLFNIPSLIYAQGIGPVKKPLNKRMILYALSKTCLIILRDEQSKILLRKWGLKEKPIFVNADPSFLLEAGKISETVFNKYQFDSFSEIPGKKIEIGIAIRSSNKKDLSYESEIKKFAQIGDYLIKKYQAKLFFIPFHINTDLPFMEKIVKQMKLSSSAKCIRESLTPDQTLTLVSKFDLMIGMRFHSIVFATMMNIPFIAINYDPKVHFLVKSIGLSELLISPDQLTVKNMDNALQCVKINQKKIRSILSLKNQQLKERALLNNVYFYQLLEKLNIRKFWQGSVR